MGGNTVERRVADVLTGLGGELGLRV